jgi:hypothetical protein
MIKSTNQQHFARLVAALETLENFTKKNSNEPIPHVYHQNVPKGSTFNKILVLGQCFIKTALSQKAREKNDRQRLHEESQVLHAINEVKRFHPLVDKLLATRLAQTIRQYNEIVERAQSTPENWENRILKFLYQKSKLSISKTHTFILKLDEAHVSDKINSNLTSKATPREIDAFRTKAISLLKDRNIFPSVEQILQSVRNGSIETIESESTITLHQKLTDTVMIKGVFERYPGGSRPISSSFQLYTDTPTQISIS